MNYSSANAYHAGLASDRLRKIEKLEKENKELQKQIKQLKKQIEELQKIQTKMAADKMMAISRYKRMRKELKIYKTATR